MSHWRSWALNMATFSSGLVAALAGARVAAALFPVSPLADTQRKPMPRAVHAAPLQSAASNPASLAVVVPSSLPYGESVGEFKISFYVLAEEDSHEQESYDTPIYRRDGTKLGMYPKRFVADLRLQGSARLKNGDVLAHAGPCEYGQGICYRILSRGKFPWGQGASGRALKILRSAAFDPRVVPPGSAIYIPEFDGYTHDGQMLDGCFSADDTGGAIRGKIVDIFAGSRKVVALAKKQIPTLRTTLYRGGARCGEQAKETAITATIH